MNTTNPIRQRARRRFPLYLAIGLLPFPMLASAVDLIGVVRQNNAGAAGIVVKLRPEKPPAAGPERNATSDSQGRFVVSNLVPGDYLLSCGGVETSIHIDYASNRAVCVH